MKKQLILAFLLFSTNAFSYCNVQLTRHQRHKQLAERSVQVGLVATAAASFFTPLASLITSGVFAAAAAAFDEEARKAWKKYEKCLSEVEHMQDLEREENFNRARKEKEEKAKKDAENDAQSEREEKEDFDHDPELMGIRARDKQELQALIADYNHDPEPDGHHMAQIENAERLIKQFEDLKNKPLEAAVQIAVNIATAPITEPLRLIGIKPPKIKVKKPW